MMVSLSSLERACVLGLVLCSMTFTCAPSQSQDIDSPFDLGPFAVGHRELEFESHGRIASADMWYPVDAEDAIGEAASYRPILSVDFVFPSAVAFASPIAAAGQFPLLMYYHGSSVTASSQATVHEQLASHGFIVVGPNGSRATTVLDIDEIIGSSQKPNDPLFNRIDPQLVGAFGLSAGGPTTFIVARDERVKAIMPISTVHSPLEPGVPTLLLAGTYDFLRGTSSSLFSTLETTPRYFADIEGAYHTSYGMVCDRLDYARSNEAPHALVSLLELLAEGTCSPRAIANEQAVDLTSFLAVSFFKTHVAGDAAYGEYLTADYIQSQGMPMAFDVAVPEPTTLALLALGMISLAFLRRRR